MKYLIGIVGAVIGAAGGYGITIALSPSDAPVFTAITTAVFGGVILSAAFSGVNSAFTAK